MHEGVVSEEPRVFETSPTDWTSVRTTAIVIIVVKFGAFVVLPMTSRVVGLHLGNRTENLNVIEINTAIQQCLKLFPWWELRYVPCHRNTFTQFHPHCMYNHTIDLKVF